jgi:hypothetical protein
LALCFEITINDGSPVFAGLDDISVLSACLTFVSSRNELEFRAGGLVSKGRHDNEHLEWLQRALGPGDSISIRIVEAAVPSAPVSRARQDPAVSERQERAYYERLKERYEPK